MRVRVTTPNVGRSLETGTILGILVGVLAVTGLAISPTIQMWTGAIDAELGYWVYATHLASASLLVVFLVWHLLPFGHSFSRKRGAVNGWVLVASHVLLAFVLVEIVTGVVLYFHLYDVLDKRVAALTHLVTTFIVLAPLGVHVWRGVRVWLGRRASRATAMAAAEARGREAQAAAAQDAVSRRSFLRLSAMAVAGVGLAFAFGRYAFGDVMGWRVNKVGKVPPLTKDGYRLRITGLVARPVELTFQQLRALPERTVDITHHCVEGWSYRDTFTGVSLPTLLAAAGGVLPGAKQLILKSPEVSEQYFGAGQLYSSSIPARDVTNPDIFVVYAVQGKDLPVAHGFPVRAMSSRKWGYKMTKYLVEIEVTGDASYRGYWERLGYHAEGDHPGPIWA